MKRIKQKIMRSKSASKESNRDRKNAEQIGSNLYKSQSATTLSSTSSTVLACNQLTSPPFQRVDYSQSECATDIKKNREEKEETKRNKLNGSGGLNSIENYRFERGVFLSQGEFLSPTSNLRNQKVAENGLIPQRDESSSSGEGELTLSQKGPIFIDPRLLREETREDQANYRDPPTPDSNFRRTNKRNFSGQPISAPDSLLETSE
eukprot:TRINITY_DN3859_c0_g1_i1.p1 TRINITY_DN3859_c0_g1~~TRINITY_DN3859_c0_g1_i1.p1  ORF type:complete len:206 (+),score=70.50 TRINITY_DN3859_c0_g1_i1:120-737(+)